MSHAQKTYFVFRAKRTSPFKYALCGWRQFSRLLAAEVCGISGSNPGYTVFRGSAKGTGYPLHSPVSPSLPPPVRHRVPSHFDWTLQLIFVVEKHALWVPHGISVCTLQLKWKHTDNTVDLLQAITSLALLNFNFVFPFITV